MSANIIHTFSFVFIITSVGLLDDTAFSSEVLREAHVIPDCQFVTQCDDNQEYFGENNVSILKSEMGTVEVFLEEYFQTSIRLDISERDMACEDGGTIPYLSYSCKMPDKLVSSNCTRQEIILKYLITGCYSVVNNKNEMLHKFLIQTDYTLKNLEEDCAITPAVGVSAEGYTNIVLRLKPFLMNSTLKFCLNDSISVGIPEESELWWIVEIRENQYENIIIERNIPGNGSVECVIVEQYEFQDLHCQTDWEKNKFLMIYWEESNNPADYIMACQDITFVKRVERIYDTINYNLPVTSISDTASVLFLFFIPLLGVSTCLCVKLFKKNNNKSNFEPSSRGNMPQKYCLNLKYKVLLLYPQDCEYFMDIMKRLKELLQSFNCFEVLDYFDPKRRVEVDPDPQGWIRTLILEKDVRIILSETYTSVLYQTCVDKKCIINYNCPKPHNTLFAYGLQMLLQSIRLEQYKRIFLIRFEDDTLKKLELSHYQRFKLPEHLSSLISCITRRTQFPVIAAVKIVTTSLKHVSQGDRSWLIQKYKFQLTCNNMKQLFFYKITI